MRKMGWAEVFGHRSSTDVKRGEQESEGGIKPNLTRKRCANKHLLPVLFV